MAQKIIWSKEAQEDFLATLAFYAERNGSKMYSEKLAGEIQDAIARLESHPELGRPVLDDSIRMIRRGNFQIYYELQHEKIVILVVWNVRRNPDELKKYLP